jgi:putative transposase
MPWKEVKPMDEKLHFITDFNDQLFDFTELCRRYGISRKTGYKYTHRYREDGPAGLEPRSSRPHHSPTKTDPKIEQAFIELKKIRPDRGAKKLIRPYRKKYPGWHVPSESTVNEILSRNNLVNHRIKTKPQHPGKPISIACDSNDLWGVDYKGPFKTRDGNYCYPLTISDYFSRYIIGCRGLYSPNLEDTKEVFRRVFQEYGLPQRIRSDNGTPFSSPTMGRLSRLSVWWIRLGIFPELIEPGEPQQNSIHERMHRTLKDATTHPPASNLPAQQRKFNDFIEDFNYDRPHEALGQEPPATLYKPSNRPFPAKLPQVEYPRHFHVRLVSTNGGIMWKHKWVNITRVLEREYIGFEEIDNDIYDVFFGPVLIGRFNSIKGAVISRRTNYQFDLDYDNMYLHTKPVT